MSEKQYIDVTFEFREGRALAGLLEDLQDIAGTRIVSMEYHAPADEDDGECDD